MIDATGIENAVVQATDGDIAVNNLQSARLQSWGRFWRMPQRPGTAQLIVEQEQLTAQFIGDPGALDRLEALVSQLAHVEPESWQTALIAAQVAGATHRFAEARVHLAQAVTRGAPADVTARLALGIDQATGENLRAVLAARRERAAQAGHWDELVPLGALLADLGEFAEAEQTYHRALREYPDVSPFALGWVCFQLGVLWGERVPAPQATLAAQWYRRAIGYLPCYVKARVHLAEIHSSCGRYAETEALLLPVIDSGDPEVLWRLADMMNAKGKFAEAEAHVRAAQQGFEALLDRYLLAFADHAAEFYAGSGGNPARAFELARLNLANRPTLRAFEQAYATATGAEEAHAASEILAAARSRWGATTAFRLSSLGVLQSAGVIA